MKCPLCGMVMSQESPMGRWSADHMTMWSHLRNSCEAVVGGALGDCPCGFHGTITELAEHLLHQDKRHMVTLALIQ